MSERERESMFKKLWPGCILWDLKIRKGALIEVRSLKTTLKNLEKTLKELEISEEPDHSTYKISEENEEKPGTLRIYDAIQSSVKLPCYYT